MINKLKYLKKDEILKRIDLLKSKNYVAVLEKTKNPQYERIYIKYGTKEVATISVFKGYFNTVNYAKSHDCTDIKFALHGSDVTIVVNCNYSSKLSYGSYGCVILADNCNKGVGGLFKTRMPSQLEAEIASVCNSLKLAYNHNLIKCSQSIVVKSSNLQVVQLFSKFDVRKFKRFSKYVEFMDKFKAENNLQIFFSYFNEGTLNFKKHASNAKMVSTMYFKRGYNNAVQAYSSSRHDI